MCCLASVSTCSFIITPTHINIKCWLHASIPSSPNCEIGVRQFNHWLFKLSSREDYRNRHGSVDARERTRCGSTKKYSLSGEGATDQRSHSGQERWNKDNEIQVIEFNAVEYNDAELW